MLVLSRRPQESFRIGHDIVITVLEVSGDKVRIGIDAPSHVQVHRQEVYLEVQKANLEAASASPSAAADLAAAIRGQSAPAAEAAAPEPDEPDGTDRPTA
ncbi:carbon storage regulator CsrA [Phycicoccus sp. Root101]|uniref:carbon storage regulator CsrA n=1 Tax=Phycicoccus sp. Root101 TaxID=1736421 RepID=UPI0009EB1413|nr:carbon storage regulator CsrA [Phycicoccus sp. Root101]